MRGENRSCVNDDISILVPEQDMTCFKVYNLIVGFVTKA